MMLRLRFSRIVPCLTFSSLALTPLFTNLAIFPSHASEYYRAQPWSLFRPMLALVALVTFTAALYSGLRLVNRLKFGGLQHLLVSAAVLLLLPAALTTPTSRNMRMVLSLLTIALAGT